MPIKKETRGAKKGRPKPLGSGRKKGSGEKTSTFLGIRVSPEEKKELSEIFENFKEEKGLSSSEAIKKIIYDLEKSRN